MFQFGDSFGFFCQISAYGDSLLLRLKHGLKAHVQCIEKYRLQ